MRRRGMEGLPHALRREREVADRDTGRVAHRRRDGWRHRQKRPFTHALRPVRTGPVSVLNRIALHPHREVHACRDPVVDRAEVPDAAGLVEDVMLHQCVAEPHYSRALVLAPNLQGIERLAHVRHGDVARQGHISRFAIDIHLDRGAVELVERRGAAQRVVRVGLLPRLADADDLAAETAQPTDEQVANGQNPIVDTDLSTVDSDLALRHPFESNSHRADLRVDVAARTEDGVAHQHGRAAGRCLLVVRHDRRVAHDDGHPLQRRAELVGRDLGEDRSRTLAHIGRARIDNHTSVGEEAHRRVGEARRRP